MIGFEFNGVHSSMHGIVIKSINRSILPGMIKKEIQIPGRHGVYDFSDNTYDNRIINVAISYIGSSINDLRLNARNISAWLSQQTYCKLIFDDEPDKYYMAKLYSNVGLENFLRYGKSTIQLECQPHAMLVGDTGTNFTWGDDLSWGMDISWDSVDDYTIAVTGNTTFNIPYLGNYELGLGSQVGSKFDIIISGSFTTLTLTLNGNTITYGEAVASDIVIIDNVNLNIKKSTTNKLSVCTGDLTEFLKLIPGGVNQIAISGTGLNCSILFDIRNQYI